MHAPSPQHLTWIARGAGVVMLLLAVFSVYAVATCYEPPVDPDRLYSIYEGSTRDDVRAALGEPTSIEDDGRKWLYAKFMKVRVVQVVFDDDDLVISRGYTDEAVAAVGASAMDDEPIRPLRYREVESDEPQPDAAPPDDAEGSGFMEASIE